MGQLYAYYVQKSVTAAAKIFNGIIDDAENKIIYIARVWNCRQDPKKLRP